MNKKLIIYITFIFLIVGCNNIKNEAEIEGTKVEKTDVISDQVVPNQKLNKEQQIASALFAAPLEAREGAMVYGYDKDGNFVIPREGHNEMICIADDPNKDGFEVVSYHNQLEPYMARGRELKETDSVKSASLKNQKVGEIRHKDCLGALVINMLLEMLLQILTE